MKEAKNVLNKLTFDIFIHAVRMEARCPSCIRWTDNNDPFFLAVLSALLLAAKLTQRSDKDNNVSKRVDYLGLPNQKIRRRFARLRSMVRIRMDHN